MSRGEGGDERRGGARPRQRLSLFECLDLNLLGPSKTPLLELPFYGVLLGLIGRSTMTGRLPRHGSKRWCTISVAVVEMPSRKLLPLRHIFNNDDGGWVEPLNNMVTNYLIVKCHSSSLFFLSHLSYSGLVDVRVWHACMIPSTFFFARDTSYSMAWQHAYRSEIYENI